MEVKLDAGSHLNTFFIFIIGLFQILMIIIKIRMHIVAPIIEWKKPCTGVLRISNKKKSMSRIMQPRITLTISTRLGK